MSYLVSVQTNVKQISKQCEKKSYFMTQSLSPHPPMLTHTRPSDIFEPNIERHCDKIFFTWVSKLINFHTKFEFTYTSETNLKSD